MQQELPAKKEYLDQLQLNLSSYEEKLKEISGRAKFANQIFRLKSDIAQNKWRLKYLSSIPN